VRKLVIRDIVQKFFEPSVGAKIFRYKLNQLGMKARHAHRPLKGEILTI
jgi:hypothetical protein